MLPMIGLGPSDALYIWATVELRVVRRSITLGKLRMSIIDIYYLNFLALGMKKKS